MLRLTRVVQAGSDLRLKIGGSSPATQMPNMHTKRSVGQQPKTVPLAYQEAKAAISKGGVLTTVKKSLLTAAVIVKNSSIIAEGILVRMKTPQATWMIITMMEIANSDIPRKASTSHSLHSLSQCLEIAISANQKATAVIRIQQTISPIEAMLGAAAVAIKKSLRVAKRKITIAEAPKGAERNLFIR